MVPCLDAMEQDSEECQQVSWTMNLSMRWLNHPSEKPLLALPSIILSHNANSLCIMRGGHAGRIWLNCPTCLFLVSVVMYCLHWAFHWAVQYIANILCDLQSLVLYPPISDHLKDIPISPCGRLHEPREQAEESLRQHRGMYVLVLQGRIWVDALYPYLDKSLMGDFSINILWCSFLSVKYIYI